MADRVLFIGWNRPVAGREKHVFELWQKAMAYYVELQKNGRIESFEPVILAAHGGDLNGFVLLRGSEQKLAEVRRENTFVDLTVESGYCLEGFGVVVGYVGEGLTDLFARWTKAIGN